MADLVVHLIRGSKIGLIVHENEALRIIPLPEFITDDTLDSIKRFLRAGFKKGDFPKTTHGDVLRFKVYPMGTSINSIRAA